MGGATHMQFHRLRLYFAAETDQMLACELASTPSEPGALAAFLKIY